MISCSSHSIPHLMISYMQVRSYAEPPSSKFAATPANGKRFGFTFDIVAVSTYRSHDAKSRRGYFICRVEPNLQCVDVSDSGIPLLKTEDALRQATLSWQYSLRNGDGELW
mmetsp:Transcript_42570/g.76652  ORF Transcript_42570/g.76652 Transcript_42570/m.76652 type:complete len:111 (+) Transcript_42570:21-353(+)